MFNIEDKTICIIGAKRSGFALARLVKQLRGKSKISDAQTIERKAWLSENRIAFEENGHSQEFIESSDYVVISPGVRHDAEVVQWTKAKHIPVMTEVEFAYQFCQAPVIAVTGSNGKTTVVTLIDQVLKAAGLKSCVCGNVGVPFSDYVLDSQELDYIILEISSFQLESLLEYNEDFEDFHPFKPKIALINNLSENHLDRHKDIDEYFLAKKKIFCNQDESDHAILNAANAFTERFADKITSNVTYFNAANDIVLYPGCNPNELAVLAVGKVLGLDDKTALKVFQSFQGVEHRMELVTKIDEITVINDSKSTTPEATRYALTSLNQPIILICGGRDKMLDFSIITELVKQRVKAIVAIGEAKRKIQATFEDVVDVHASDDLREAIIQAMELAQEGDAVLLSPMCASFDMFDDYEERGRVFKEYVFGLLNQEQTSKL